MSTRDPADAARARVDAELAAIEAVLPSPFVRERHPFADPAGPPPPDPRDAHARAWGLLVLAGLAGLIVGLAVGLARGAAPPRPAWLPDPALTPGAVVPLDAPAICDRGYAGRARNVTEATKREVFRRYGLPWADRDRYEVDHLVPLAVGGANELANLWPQPWAAPLGARDKDRLEVRMRARLCSGSIGLAAAQAAFRGDWTRAYRAEGLDAPPPAAALPAGPVAPPDPEGFEPDDDRGGN